MTLPPHIAQAPTPRADGYPLIKFEGCDVIAIAPEDLAQLERQLIWAEEVIKNLSEVAAHDEACFDNRGNFYRCVCGLEAARAALNEYKQGTKEV